jgi:hypothetical protein
MRTLARLTLLAVVGVAAILVQAGPAASDGVVASANGSGQFASGGQSRTFAFAATKHADDSVRGRA